MTARFLDVYVTSVGDEYQAKEGDHMSAKTTRFERTLETVSAASVGMDQKGVIRFANRQSQLLFGYDRDDLIGRPIEALVPEPFRQILASHREEYFSDHRSRSMGLDLELRGRHHDGTEFPINITLSQIDTGDVLLVITAVHDVAKRKWAVRNAVLTAAVVEYSDEAVIDTTLEGVVTRWNPAAERMYGYSSIEIIGRSGTFLTPDDRVGELFANLARVKDGQHLKHVETTCVRKDGSVVPVSITVAPIRDEGGIVVGASTIARDLTDLEAARYARTLVKADPDPLLTISTEGRINDVNEATVKVTGVPRDQLIGTEFSQYFSERDKANEFYRQAFVQDSITHYPLTLRHQDGTLTGLLFTGSVYRNSNGNVLGVLAFARDLTEQQEAWASVQRTAAIIKYSNDAILGRTLEGVITSWNPAAERMFGFPSAEIVGKSVDLMIPVGRRKEAQAAMARVSAGHAVVNLETVRNRRDGMVIRVSLTVAPIRDVDGATVGACVIARDRIDEV